MAVSAFSRSEAVLERSFKLGFQTASVAPADTQVFLECSPYDILGCSAYRDLSHGRPETIGIALSALRPFAWIIPCLFNPSSRSGF
jgi:hypothetical protein